MPVQQLFPFKILSQCLLFLLVASGHHPWKHPVANDILELQPALLSNWFGNWWLPPSSAPYATTYNILYRGKQNKSILVDGTGYWKEADVADQYNLQCRSNEIQKLLIMPWTYQLLTILCSRRQQKSSLGIIKCPNTCPISDIDKGRYVHK